ncbi:hypothetical protein [Leptospira alexanderi]|uniref:hypothetical protein n=1 Tax=Leptospira alexanderi TaxID=100053 RepID=UPI0009910A6A|nr:hypothetical protein [Leptospira alexanderi]
MFQKLFIFFSTFLMSGCLHFKQPLIIGEENSKINSKFKSEKFCFEFKKEEMDGVKVLKTGSRFETASLKIFNVYRRSIEDAFFKFSGILHCATPKQSNYTVIRISLNVRGSADCLIKRNPEDFNGCQVWGYVSLMSFFVVPFWGKASSEVIYEIVDSDSSQYIFHYRPSVYFIDHILLLPISWIVILRSVKKGSFVETVEAFLSDSGISVRNH